MTHLDCARHGRPVLVGNVAHKNHELRRVHGCDFAVRCRRCRRSLAPVDHMEMTYLANRTEWLVECHDEGLHSCGWWQEFTAVLDHRLSIAVGKESEMADLHKTDRQDMQKEPPDKFGRVE